MEGGGAQTLALHSSDSGFMYFFADCIISVLLLVAVVGIFHNDEYEKDAQRLSENVFRLMDYELSDWEEQDIGCRA